jgi:sporulation protein YlmC with PRC-barrel domain
MDRPLARSADTGVVRLSDEIELAPDDVSESTVRHYAGKDVHSPDGKKLGSVDDFIIDANSGRIACAVVSTGIFGSGDKRAVPVSALNASEDGFMVNIQEAQWKQAPTLDKDAYDDGRPTMSASERTRLNELYNVREGSPATASNSNATPSYARASKLRGMQVVSAGREVGEIESVVIDPKSGKASVLLDPDNDALDTDEKFLVPLAKLKVNGMNKDSDSINTDMSVEDLRKASTQRVVSARDRE